MRRLFLPGGTRSAGPYELRLPIFLQPLGGALKNRSAAPASPPCFRRRRRSAPLLFESTLATLYKLPDKTETPVSLQHWSSWWARVDYASRAEKESGSRLPAAASCLERHAHPAGRSPNSSSLFLPLAAVVAVAQGLSPAGLFGGSMLFESTRSVRLTLLYNKNLSVLDTSRLFGGRGWIRTSHFHAHRFQQIQKIQQSSHFSGYGCNK